jgi:hypothetical protein
MVGNLKLAKVLGTPTVEIVVTTATAKVRQSTCSATPALHSVAWAFAHNHIEHPTTFFFFWFTVVSHRVVVKMP